MKLASYADLMFIIFFLLINYQPVGSAGLLEYTYGIKTPDPEFKDGKLVFGGQFEKTPEEFVYDLATLEPPVD